MRIHIVLAALGVGLLAVTSTACSSGAKSASKTTSVATLSTTSASTGAASTPAAATSSAASSTPATSASATSGGSAAKEVDACTLLTAAKASTLVGAHLSSAKSSTIATGQDQCDYDGSRRLTVIVYQPTSGVSWNIMTSVLKGVGDTKNVAGVGDRAMVGAIELDVQAGPRLIAVQGAGGLLSGDYKGAVAVAKAVVAGLH